MFCPYWSIRVYSTAMLTYSCIVVGRGRAGNFQVLHQGKGGTGGHANVGQYFSTAINRGGLLILFVRFIEQTNSTRIKMQLSK